MTAIVWAYGRDGFIIAADGRRIDSDTHRVDSDDVQKIFAVKVGDLRLVYAWHGNVHLEMVDGTVVSFKVITDCIIQSMDMTSITSFAQFVERFRDALFPASVILFQKNVQKYQQDKPIVGVVFLAYFDGQPYFTEMEIYHDGNKILRPEVEIHPASGKFRVFSGSEMAYKEFGECNKASLTLSDFADEAKRYIEICYKYQNEDAFGIGGHIHIGQLEPQGFTWRLFPKR